MMQTSWAVIDVETTGLGKHDRIIEIAIVLLDGQGVKKEWDSLINPLRDVSNGNIHGLSASHLSLAPTFSEMAEEIAYLLDGRILVAHNIVFDKRMLKNEFDRLGFNPDYGYGLCTYKATRLTLGSACAEYGIVNSNSHSAIGDALATAKLLEHLDVDTSQLRPFQVGRTIRSTGSRRMTRNAFSDIGHAKRKYQYIVEDALPQEGDHMHLAYLEALSHYLADLKLSKEEAQSLEDWANDVGLTEKERLELHTIYFESLYLAALRDGEISSIEKELLIQVAESLQIPVPHLPNSPSQGDSIFENLRRGSKICFTGMVRDSESKEVPREDLERMARSKGFISVNSVSKKNCDLLVASDTTSMSGKAKKAREYGIPIAAAEDFLKWVKN